MQSKYLNAHQFQRFLCRDEWYCGTMVEASGLDIVLCSIALILHGPSTYMHGPDYNQLLLNFMHFVQSFNATSHSSPTFTFAEMCSGFTYDRMSF